MRRGLQGREGSRATLEKEVSSKGIREEDGFIALVGVYFLRHFGSKHVFLLSFENEFNFSNNGRNCIKKLLLPNLFPSQIKK